MEPRYGTVREDGYYFTGRQWLSPEAWARSCERKRVYARRRYTEIKADPGKVVPYRVAEKGRYVDMKTADPVRVMLYRTRASARRRGMDCDLQPEDIVIPTHCPVLGIELRFDSGNKDLSPSIDRIENTRGYVRGNIVVTSWRANRIKSDASIDELAAVAAFYSTLKS
jgi:hypothetical protein